jgi:hypothetical protein
MKVAKIIATSFAKRSFRAKTYLIGSPLGFFGHSQIFGSPQDILNLIKFNISIEKKIDPGVDKRDLIIINNDIGYKKGNTFLKKISGKKIPFGKIITCNRKNTGMSFGAYNYAFKKFKNKYDYFLFTEDDTIIAKKNYFKIGIDLLNSSFKAGFVAYIHSTKVHKRYFKALNLKKENAISCHGATGLSSNYLLNKVLKKKGCLPYYNGNDYIKCITYGEIGFPNAFVQLGYKIVDLPKDLILTVPACDLLNKILYKKWPSSLEKIIFYIKKNIYDLFSLTKFTQAIYLKVLKTAKNYARKYFL